MHFCTRFSDVIAYSAGVFFESQFFRESAMLKLPEERMRWGEYIFSPLSLPLSFFHPRTYRKGYYFYSPQSSTVIKSKMAATTTRTRFRPPKIRLHCRLQTSFRGETSGSIAKCRLFTQSKHVPESTYGMPLDSWMCLGLHCVLEVFLPSGKCFWILRRVLDSGKCFVRTSHRSSQITDTAIHSLSAVCREMCGRHLSFGFLKITLLLALITPNPD